MKYSITDDIVLIPEDIDPFSNPLWALFLRVQQSALWEQYLSQITLPTDVYSIAFRIFPTDTMLTTTSDLMGIQQAIYKSFQNLTNETKEKLTERKSIIIVSFDSSPLFKYPTIEIEILILGDLSDELKQDLKQNSITNVFSEVGDIPILQDFFKLKYEDIIQEFFLPIPEKNTLTGLFNLRNYGNDLTSSQQEQLEFLATRNIFELDLSTIFSDDFQIKSFNEFLNVGN
jgi:hypothetical protein